MRGWLSVCGMGNRILRLANNLKKSSEYGWFFLLSVGLIISGIIMGVLSFATGLSWFPFTCRNSVLLYGGASLCIGFVFLFVWFIFFRKET